MYICLGCEYVIFWRPDGCHCCGEVGTSQTSGATGSHARRLKTRLVGFIYVTFFIYLFIYIATNGKSKAVLSMKGQQIALDE